MANIASTVTFDVDKKGEVSGRSFVGTFIAKTKTSIMETLKEDQIYRRVLGENPQDAADDIKRIAGAYAYLQIRLVEWPDWWKDAGFGLGLEDLGILADVNNKAQEKIRLEYEKLTAEAEKAKPELKAEAEKI
jgi:hypothetical protein